MTMKKPPRKKAAPHQPSSTPSPASDTMRLNRYIAHAGVCSRREADSLIEKGDIRVNGQVVKELGFKVGPEDTVSYQGKTLVTEKKVYILLNKPKDYITTTNDPQNRKTVLDIIKRGPGERIYPVGRLDRNTTGLLLLTNDGDLSDKLTHPSGQVHKIYHVTLDKALTKTDFEKITAGVELEDGVLEVDDLAYASPDKRDIGIEIHSGKNRVIRRLFEALGYTVLKLDRVIFAGLTKKDLPRGKWRYLSEKEVITLKHFSK